MRDGRRRYILNVKMLRHIAAAEGGGAVKPAVYTILWEAPLTKEARRQLLAGLPPVRRARLAPERPERWDQPLLAWGLLAWAARRHWGEFPAVAVEAGGRPWFPDRPDCHFSLSHTEGGAACALWDRPVGVDLERPRQVSPRLLELLGAGDQRDFLRRWTCREAAAKREGRGGVRALQSPAAGEEDCQVFPLERGYLLAVAAAGEAALSAVCLEELLTELREGGHSRRGPRKKAMS